MSEPMQPERTVGESGDAKQVPNESDLESAQPVSEQTQEVLSELYERYRQRGRGWTGTKPRRRGAKKTPVAGEDRASDGRVGQYRRSRRFQGIDWAKIAQYEAADGTVQPPGSIGDTDAEDLGVPAAPSHANAPSGTSSSITNAHDPQGEGWAPGYGLHRSKTGTGKSKFDPRKIGSILERELTDREWRSSLAVGSVVGRWEEIVGDLVASHCPVESFNDGRLVVRADSSAWAQQLQLLLPEVMARIDQVVGQGVVNTLIVQPPQGPSWRHGGRHISGRGPRDTYG